ncbi:MAG: cyclic nucleotide-binding domain-containing protein [Deltaproteobacteria bacterium]|nr:cyclic nucleotide-binding domain-containing protein [Deltaproteobacteria bacterium]
MKHLYRLLNIKEGEGKPVVLLFTYFFFFGATLTVSKTARDAYFLNRFDISYLPLMFLAAACAVALTVVVYNFLAKRLDLIPGITLSSLTFILSLILIQSHLEGGVIPILYIWVDVITTVISVQFWVAAGMVFNSRQAKRLFGIILAGSPVARIVIGTSIPSFVNRFGSAYLLTLAAGFILCCVLMAWLIRPYFIRGVSEKSRKEKRRDKTGFLDGYMRMIALAVGAAAVATVIVEYQFLILSNQFFPMEQDLASFFGIFYALTGAISLFAQVFLTGWILTRFGVLPAMLALPAGLGIGSLSLLINPLFYSSLITKILEQITKFTVNKTSLELLWVPVGPDGKQNRKLFIEGTIRTGLQGLTGVLIYALLTTWHLSYPVLLRLLSFIALVAIGIWVLSAYRLKREYVSSLMLAIEKRRLDFERMRLDTTDSDIIATIDRALDSDEAAQQVFVLELIENLSLIPWRNTLNRLFWEASPLVQKKILSMTAEQPEIVSNTEIRAKIEEQGPLTKDALIIAGKRHMTEMIPSLGKMLEGEMEGEADIRAAAAIAILIMDREFCEVARSTLGELLKSEDETQKILVLQMLLYIPTLLTDAQLRECLESESIRIRMETLKIVHHRGDENLIPHVIDCLDCPQLRTSARGLLKTYPADKVIAAMDRACYLPETSMYHQIEIIRTLRVYPDLNSIRCLVSLFEESSIPIQAETVDTLLEIARQNPLPASVLTQFQKEGSRIARDIYEDYQLLSGIEKTSESLLLRDLFKNEIRKLAVILFKLLVLRVPETPVETYLIYVQSGDTSKIPDLLEVLENILPKNESGWMIPLIKPMSIKDRSLAGRRYFRDLPNDLDKKLLQWIQSTNEWSSGVALDYTLSQGLVAVLEEVDWLSFPDDGLQSEIIGRDVAREKTVLNDLREFPKDRFREAIKESNMLSTLEKTIILKGTSLFKGISGEELFHVAQVMEEERLEKGSTLFRKGDIGDCLYVIVSGEIRIHIDQLEVRRHVKGDYFGEMALLDGSPRSASATAMDETLLLKINRENFYDIMMSRHDVLRGVLKMMTERIRELTERYAHAP